MTLTLATLIVSTCVLFASGWWRGARRELPVTVVGLLGLVIGTWWLAQPGLENLSLDPVAIRGWRPVLQPFSQPVTGDELVALVANSVPALAIWTVLIGTAYWVTGRRHRKGRRSQPGSQERLAGALLATANGLGVWWLVLPAVAELTPPVPDVWPSLTGVADIVRTAPDGVWRTAALPGRLTENWINIATPAVIAVAVYLMSRKSRPRQRQTEPEVVIRT
jgi:hypothetical protein